MPLRTLQELVIKNQRVLLRGDFNVPLIEGSAPIEIRDDLRLRAALPTIRYLLEQGATKIIAMSHLGNPKSREATASLRPISERLELLLGEKVTFIDDCVGSRVEEEIVQSTSRIILLENLRFHAGEKKLETEPSFVEAIAKLGDCYVNDAFGTAHRTDSSCCALAMRFKGKAAAGFLLEKEYRFLSEQFEKPERPFIAIVGGAKISTKLGVLEKLLDRCDKIVIVGAMAYTFLLAQGIKVGRSLSEPECIDQAKRILQRAKDGNKELLLPLDIVIASGLEEGSTVRLVPTSAGIDEPFEGVDIGPETIKAISQLLKGARTLFWNGPAGVFEQPRFAKGTKAVAELLALHEATTIVGGGDSAAAIEELKLSSKFDHVSTGGGASLELIEKGDLPALAALRDAFE